jgi:hypothetical protein
METLRCSLHESLNTGIRKDNFHQKTFAILLQCKLATGVNDAGGRIFPEVFFDHRSQRQRWKIYHRYQRQRWQITSGINDNGGKLPPVSTTTVANMPLVSNTTASNSFF